MATDPPPITPIGYGAFKIGRNRGIKYPGDFDLPDDAQVDRLLNEVLDLGIGWIDTAPAYGLSEQRIGRSISHRRDEFLLSTKVGESFQDGQSRFDFSADAVRSSVHQSLKHLRTDHLDVVFVHCARDDLSILRDTDVLETLARLKTEGLLFSIGASIYTTDALRYAIPHVDYLMAEYNLDNPSHADAIDAAAQSGVTVVVKKGLASGRLEPEPAVRFVLSCSGVASLCVASLNLDHLRQLVTLARRLRAWPAG